MKELKICYYDNVIAIENPRHLVYEFVEHLLDWVDTHNAFLVIKTKTYWYHWSYRRKFKIILRKWASKIFGYLEKTEYELIKVKDVYSHYPKHIKEKFPKLIKEGKLIFSWTKSDIVPGLLADVVVVLPMGEVMQHFNKYNRKPKILFFDCRLMRPSYIKVLLNDCLEEK